MPCGNVAKMEKLRFLGLKWLDSLLEGRSSLIQLAKMVGSAIPEILGHVVAKVLFGHFGQDCTYQHTPTIQNPSIMQFQVNGSPKWIVRFPGFSGL